MRVFGIVFNVNTRVMRATAMFVLLCCAVSVAAEEGDKSPKKENENPPKKESENPPKADPTQASSKLKQALKGPEKGEVKVAPVVKIPEITLKGLLQAEGKPPAAVLDIKGRGLVTVVEDSRVMLPGDENHALVIKKVSAEGVQIEVPGVKELLVVK